MRLKKIIKESLPKNYIYRREYRLRKENAKKTYAEVEKELDIEFEKRFGRKINWDLPTTYNEKINVAKLYDASPLKAQLTDKISVVEWVKEKIGDECEFIPLLGTYDSVDEIDFDKMPSRFVMKMNNDSGSVVVCDEKNRITNDTILKYKYFLQKRDYAYNGYEMQYKGIKPKIMIEKYMGNAIRDYKFQCFGGKACSCRVDFDRFGEHTRNFYDKNWELLPYNKGDFRNHSEKVVKPINFEKMWRMAEKLSEGFDQVRVDFYDIDDTVYFGEMTFTNGAGFEEFHPEEIDLKMGELWRLDMKSIRRRRKKLLEAGAKIGD